MEQVLKNMRRLLQHEEDLVREIDRLELDEISLKHILRKREPEIVSNFILDLKQVCALYKLLKAGPKWTDKKRDMERMRNCFKRAQRELQNLGKKSPFFYSVDELLERYHLTDVNSLQEEIAHTEQHLQRWINLFKEELDFMKRPRGDRPSHGLKEAVRSFFIDHFDEPPTNKQLKDIFSIANNPFQKDKASS